MLNISMTRKELRKNNVLIGKFMGGKGRIILTSTLIMTLDNKEYKETDLKYHKKWDWLMPVVEKICRMRIGDGKSYIEYAYPRTFGMLDKESGGIMVRLEGHQVVLADTLIEATYFAIIDFIEHYNENFTNKGC